MIEALFFVPYCGVIRRNRKKVETLAEALAFIVIQFMKNVFHRRQTYISLNHQPPLNKCGGFKYDDTWKCISFPTSKVFMLLFPITMIGGRDVCITTRWI